MLSRLARELPTGDVVYEPKWDGFRCIAFRDGDEVELQSRNGRPLARYFPEIVDVLRALGQPRFVIDGELVLVRDGLLDFAALMRRLHPAASLVARLAREQPARYIAFDAVAIGDDDLRDHPFVERRAALERLLARAPETLRLTCQTADRNIAERWLQRTAGGGIDGVMVKERTAPYVEGARRLHKVKPQRTADCVVAGLRTPPDQAAVSSLLLGLYDDTGALVHVGVCSSFTARVRRDLYTELSQCHIAIDDHPWRDGYLLAGGTLGRLPGSAGRWDPRTMGLDWIPVRPERVCEVAYEQVDHGRFRHPARFQRWRPDREPHSCQLRQLTDDEAAAAATGINASP